MRLVGAEILVEFTTRHPQAKSWVSAWVKEVHAASWRRPQDVKDRYASASFVGDDKVIFNVKGNSFRMEVLINYSVGIVRVIRCGTRAEYDRWN
jgi:mRNA interferase HigB